MDNSLNNWSGKTTGYGLTAVSLGGATAMTTAGAAVEVAAPIAVAGGTLATTGVAASLTGNLMMANSNSNKSQGYNRGKKSNVSSGNKNSPHANQKSLVLVKDTQNLYCDFYSTNGIFIVVYAIKIKRVIDSLNNYTILAFYKNWDFTEERNFVSPFDALADCLNIIHWQEFSQEEKHEFEKVL